MAQPEVAELPGRVRPAGPAVRRPDDDIRGRVGLRGVDVLDLLAVAKKDLLGFRPCFLRS